MDADRFVEWDRHLRYEVDGLALRSGRSVYPSVDTALVCLDWLETNGLVVLGIEGFDTDGRHVLPRLGHIADFGVIEGTASERVARSIEAARRVLSEWIGRVQFVDLTVEVPSDEPPTSASPPSVITL